MSNTYKIERLADILTIPDDRLDDFMVELRQWVELCRSMQELISVTSAAIGSGVTPEVIPIYMDWIDDGKRNISVILSPIAPEEEQ